MKALEYSMKSRIITDVVWKVKQREKVLDAMQKVHKRLILRETYGHFTKPFIEMHWPNDYSKFKYLGVSSRQ